MTYDRITVDPDQMDGVPCIRGLRIPVTTVLSMLGEGMDENEILEAYPDLEPEDIQQVLQFASETLDEREIPLDKTA